MCKYFALSLTCLMAAFVACSKSPGLQQSANPAQVAASTPGGSTPPNSPSTTVLAESGKAKMDACALLTSKEIQSVQGEPLKEAKPSSRSESGFVISQCYFALPTSANSISLLVTQRGDSSVARDPKEFWKETFHRDEDAAKGREKGKDKEREEDEKAVPPAKIADVGDEAYWTGNRVGGALYALKGNTYIRVSVGGPGDQAAKIKKSKTLAQMILKHL
jgi:hypothetical protein